jgi:drug/metabolite transporter (DMT)-like permease
MTAASSPQITPRAWALLALLALIWGASFLSNKAALAQVGVLTTVAFRVLGAAILLWLYVLSRRLPVPRNPRKLLGFALMGVTNNAIPFSLIVWGQQHIPSGLAAILNATTAVFGVLVAAAVFRDERLTARKSLGVAVGFAGVATAIGIANLSALDPTSLGQIAVLGATLSYAVSGAIGKHLLAGVRPEVSAAGMVTASSLIMVPAALLAEGWPTFTYSPATWAALAYLAAVASALAYVVFYAILRIAGAGNLGLVTLMVAPVAILLGAITYGEALTPNEYAGFAILALGLLILDGRLVRPRNSRPPQDSA